VSATVGQTCVVTLEPVTNDVDEEIDLVFMPKPIPDRLVEKLQAEDDLSVEADAKGIDWNKAWKEPEPLVNGRVDLGALAAEFLVLGLDPYPRKPDAVFEPPQVAKEESPFAALANLKERDGH
jgi:uncharacterized metal-binding protein YceD (DUF177 family)